MDTSSVFRTQTVKVNDSAPQAKMNQRVSGAEVEPPFTDYHHMKGVPYVVEHYKLGEFWNEQGVYEPEVQTIEGYLTRKIELGEIANSTDSVKNELKEIEKITNMTKEERASVKLGIISAYIEFLNKTEGIKTNMRKYGNNK